MEEQNPVEIEQPLTSEAEVSDAPQGENGSEDVTVLLAKVEEYKTALQRERADFQNFRKRVDRDNELLRAKLNSEMLLKFLPIVDDFERAIQSTPESDGDVVKGFSLILRKLQGILDAEGIKSIHPLGEPFDPNYHEVIGMDEDSDYASQHVSAVLQKGYLHGEKVLRPAMVRVAN